jgi:glycosyltransferase involved in cell wall biosynthesis/2-polyprenyl-3-methyl-5-hydroxy-6-metoxy-1,4-benzoquinol methylase
MSAHPKVSVIMPAYNVAAYLEAAVRSVIRQTFTDFEVVIVDDGSTDETAKVASALQKRWPDRIRIIRQENRGLGAARNAALRAARGALFALLDSDDVWEPEFLTAQVATLDARPDIDIVTGNARYLGGPDHGRSARPHPDDRPQPTLGAILSDEEAVFIMSVFRRRVFESIGGFNEQLRTNEDYDYWLRAAHAGFQFLRNSSPLGWYRVRGESLSSDQLRMVNGILRVYRDFLPRLTPGTPEAETLRRQVLRFEAEALAPSARRGIHPRHLNNRDFLRALFVLRGRPRKRIAAAMARYAPSLFRWFDSVRQAPSFVLSENVATVGTADHGWSPRYSPSMMRSHLSAANDVVADPLTPSALHHAREVAEGERFQFGSNWARFLSLVDDQRICQAEDSLRTMLNRKDLEGVSFLDIGSGSGLFSLAARRLGARVRSFDYDPQSVACTKELRRRYFPADGNWVVDQGSILDADFVRDLGTFDIVYSWGVLHHTGHMWDALELTHQAVAPDGCLFIAIYNDMGAQTTRWRALKKTYVRLPAVLQPAFAALVFLPQEIRHAASAILRGKPSEYIKSWTGYRANRGMSKWRDIVDWVGGYPYEAAKPDAIFQFFKDRGYSLEAMRCLGGLGCNEFLFKKEPESDGARAR